MSNAIRTAHSVTSAPFGLPLRSLKSDALAACGRYLRDLDESIPDGGGRVAERATSAGVACVVSYHTGLRIGCEFDPMRGGWRVTALTPDAWVSAWYPAHADGTLQPVDQG